MQTTTKKSGKVVTLDARGAPCPRCNQATEVRAHRVISEKQLRQPVLNPGSCSCRILAPAEKHRGKQDADRAA
jgi:hypothetical protein